MSFQAAFDSFLREENNITLVLSAVLGVAVVVYFFRNRNLPPGPYGLPWLGYLPFLGDMPHLKLAHLAKRYGDVMSFTVMGKTHIHLNTLELIKEAFLVRSEDFSGRDPAFSLVNWIEDGKGITQTEGPAWKEQRQFFLQSIKKFGYGKLSLEGHIHEVIGSLLEYVTDAKGKPVDIHLQVSNCTSNIICKMVINSEFRSDDKDFKNLAHGLRKTIQAFLGTRLFYIGPVTKLIFKYLPGGKELGELKSLLHRTVQKFITQHKNTFDRNHIRDFTDCYLEELEKLREKKSTGTSFSMDTLHANNVNLLMEGTESVSFTIYGMIKELIKHPEAQEKIQKEIDNIIGSERLPSWADRTSLPYTEATLYELQRLVTPFPLSAFHSNAKETTFRGYRIPKRSMIISNLWSVHMDPKLFPEPEKFNPNRFLSAAGKFEKKEGVMIFGLGKRSCPGEPLAIMEIFLFITSLLQKFTFKDPGDNDPDQVFYKLIAIPRPR